MVELTPDEFYEHLGQDAILIVEFLAEGCVSHRQFYPIFQRVAALTPDVFLGSVSVEKESVLAQELSMFTLPHLIVFKSGIAVYAESLYSVSHKLFDFFSHDLSCLICGNHSAIGSV